MEADLSGSGSLHSSSGKYDKHDATDAEFFDMSFLHFRAAAHSRIQKQITTLDIN